MFEAERAQTGVFDAWVSSTDTQRWIFLDLPRLLVSFPSWVDRRVETIDVLSDTRFIRHNSVDLTIPNTLPPGPYMPKTLVVPVGFLRKRYLRGFDIRDEAERSVPVLTELQSRQIITTMLLPLILEELERLRMTSHLPRLKRDLQRVLAASSEDGKAVTNTLRREGAWYLVLESALIAKLIEDLAVAFVLFAVLETDKVARRVVKYSYVHRFEPRSARFRPVRSLSRWLGLAPLPLTVDGLIPGASASYHVEIAAPPGAIIAAAELSAGSEQLDFDDQEPDLAHLRYAVESHGQSGRGQTSLDRNAKAVIELWPAKDEVLRQVSRGAHLVTLLLLSGVALRLMAINHLGLSLQFMPQAASSLLVAVPALITFYLAVQQHRLLHRMLYGTLVRAGASAGLAFIAAASLSLGNYPPGGRLHLWILLGGVSLLNSASLAIGRYRASRAFTGLHRRLRKPAAQV